MRLKSGYRNTIQVLLLTIFVYFSLCWINALPYGTALAQGASPKRVLILHSYHKGHGWNDEISQGIESVLNEAEQNIELFFEFMDTKRSHDDHHLGNLAQLLIHKYKDKAIDVVISSDDHAFNFLIHDAVPLFSKMPIVFCGINYLDTSSIPPDKQYTGVMESLELKKTVELAMQLHPEIKQVFALVDKTVSGMALRKQLDKIIPHFNGKILFALSNEIEVSSIIRQLERVPKESIVLWLTLFSDKNNERISINDVEKMLKKHCSVPVYSLWEDYLGKGIVGGKLTNGFFQGKTAAMMALKILDGTPANTIQIIHKSPTPYAFDYTLLSRFNIDLAQLPANSIVINRPVSFYALHRQLIWIFAACMVVVLSIIALLSSHILYRKKTEKQIRSSKNLLEKIINTVPQSIFWKDREGRYLGCNKTYARLTGVKEPSRIIGLTCSELPGSQEEIAHFQANDKEVMETGISKTNIIEKFPNGDGEQGWIKTTIAPLQDEAGKTCGMLGIFEDITRQREMEKLLEKKIITLTLPFDNPEGIEFEDLFDHTETQKVQDEFARAMGVASLITRPDGTPITSPSNFCRFCEMLRNAPKGLANGIASDESLGRPVRNGLNISRCLGTGILDGVVAVEIRRRHLVSWGIGQVRDENSPATEEQIKAYALVIGVDPEELVKAYRDVPSMPRKHFENITQVLYNMVSYWSTMAYQNIQQARLISDLKASRHDREQLQSQLIQAQKMEAIGRLAGGVAHDFNNMLTTILANAEVALMNVPPGATLKNNLKEIVKASKQSSDLTRQLLGFARQQAIVPKVIDLNQVIDDLTRMLRRLIGESIDLEWRPFADLWAVKADTGQITQILTNLCANARDGIQGVGKIIIETTNTILDENYCMIHEARIPGDYTCICVSDTGCGMTRETVDSIFEPFFTTKAEGKGTGLGLANVYSIVQQNKGAIEVYSEPELGSTFKIYLPRYMAVPGPTSQPPPVQENIKGDETILVVEDDPGVLKITLAILKAQGYAVLIAVNPHEAVAICNEYKNPINLLLTDVVMPDMSGPELAKTLVKKRPDLNILFMSGYSKDMIRHHGIHDDITPFVGKPFSAQTLSEKIRKMLDGKDTGE
nr:ABC transporter substrate binding protein [uncultured Desulfobacter sp.]